VKALIHRRSSISQVLSRIHGKVYVAGSHSIVKRVWVSFRIQEVNAGGAGNVYVRPIVNTGL